MSRFNYWLLSIKLTLRNFLLTILLKDLCDRYAPATQLWRGRLHVMGGSKENRHTPALEHWSLAVKDGKALETEWRSEIPIPRGGPHRFVNLNDICKISKYTSVKYLFLRKQLS